MRARELFLVVASASALAVVPDWPHRHLGEPAYWGILGFIVVVASLVVRQDRSWGVGGANRRVVLLFLVGLPLVYVAAALLAGAGRVSMGLQLLGLAVWILFAASGRRWAPALWLGCAAHALWDAAHYGRADFIPPWYLVACIAADVGLAGYLLLVLPEDRAAPEAEPSLPTQLGQEAT